MKCNGYYSPAMFCEVFFMVKVTDGPRISVHDHELRDFCILQKVLPGTERTAAFGFMAAKQISNAA
ncbi:hypothetical protein HFM85_03135 [Blautia schinkii]|uniref:hypothetical protein n=1 Tax=Blautia schinkii TaxID=180164 RepID=UPI00156FFE60|nr:hypothetical protein [Blautia schinkii]NSK22003.1 hypothetical protein [Blautia schinkii]